MNLSMCLVGFKVCGFSRNSSKQQIGTGLACCTSWLNCMCVCSLYLLKLHLLFLSCYFWSVMAGLGKAFLLLLLCGLSAAWPGQMRFFGMVCGIGSTCLLDGGGNCCQEMVLQAHGP